MEHFKNVSVLLTGVLVTMVGQWLFSKVKNKIDFSEVQAEKNHDFDKRISVLEERTKKLN